MSFPSGHAAVAAGFTAALSCRYPHASGFFVLVSSATIAQRIVTTDHHPSDVFSIAALGLLGAAICLGTVRSEKA